MGADWVKFKIQPDADLQEVGELAAFVSEQHPHSHRSFRPSGFCEDEVTREKWRQSVERLESQLVFPKGELDYWDHTALTDPPGFDFEVAFGGKERIAPELYDVDACRVYVVSHNPVFPIEWRDEAYRIILPSELRCYYDKWRTYIEEVQNGAWRSYLYDLFLWDRITDEYQQQEFEDLLYCAKESFALTNAWCRKKSLSAVRDRIIEFNAPERLKSMREAIPCPRIEDALRDDSVTAKQQQKEAAYWELRQTAVAQIRDWNRLVPQNRKVGYPETKTFDDVLARADCTWLKSFFAWCETLLQREYGLYLWA